jgi:uncharacterized protein YoxC
MLETSKDVLNILLGVSFFLIAIWLSWVLYQVGKTLQNINKAMSMVQQAAESMHQLIDKLKDKASNIGTYLALMAKGGEQIFDFIKERQAKKSSSRSSKKDL